MASNDFNEVPLPVGPEKKRQTYSLLPNFFRSNSNKKFLGGTVDVVTQPGTLTRISSYVGRRDIPNYTFDDVYIQETSTPRQYYQLEPSFVNEDGVTGDVNWYGDYIDYINSLKYFGANVANHSKLNRQEAYAWNPHIDWDKFTNYREYYWLSAGPDPITVYGHLEGIQSEYTVTQLFAANNYGYIFNPDGLTVNPRLTLYRGVTYTFDVDTPNMKLAIKTENSFGDGFYYNIGVSGQNVSKGTLTFTVPHEAPDLLYYLDNTVRPNTGVIDETMGMIDIKDVKEAAYLDVETEILGKRNFKSSLGIQFINGLKLQFKGNVTPEKYSKGYWYVEGVGNKIKLINTLDLEAPATFIKSFNIPFDDQPFDSLPWENADNYPLTKDYIVINRASRDRNNWSRTNRWFHRNVLETTATANGQIPSLDQSARANRPIIEFEPDIKLYNHGYFSKTDVDLVDTVTTDVFSIIEGSTGYIVDGEQLLPGYRILFTADNDILVKGRIFEVKKILNSTENANEDIIVVSTTAISNIITVPTTQYLKVGMAVRFSGVMIGGLSSSTTYYISNTNFTSTTFSVSTKLNGPLFSLTDSASISMKVSSVGPGITSRKYQLTLQEVVDTQPQEGEIVYITKGKVYKGSSYYYENGEWNLAQKKTIINQPPLFDLFDKNLISYSNSTPYLYNTFKGTKIFNYKVGKGNNDSELGFPLVYRSIDNVGDIEFEFSLQQDSWSYVSNNIVTMIDGYEAFLRKWNDDGTFSYTNGWVETDRKTEQNVVRILKVESPTDLIPIDVYDDTNLLYSIEQANTLAYGNRFYIATQPSTSEDLTDDYYWLTYRYNEQYREEFDITVKYSQRDIVRYGTYFYIALEEVKGKLPTNSDYWQLLFQGYRYRGLFNLVDNYAIDDMVSYNGSTYISIAANGVNALPTDIGYWKILIKGNSSFQGEYNVLSNTFKGNYDNNTKYFTNDIVSYTDNNNTIKYYIAIINSLSANPMTDDNAWQLITDQSYKPSYGLRKQITYKLKDIVSYGLYLYVSNSANNNAPPTDSQAWTQLVSGSTYPQYYDSDASYQTGTIVIEDNRPKIDYRIRVYVNDKKRTDVTFSVLEGVAYINFGTALSAGDKVVYKVRSISNKNVKGYYEIPLNWQNNPLNDIVNNFTFGEVVDHVRTIVENSSEFSGVYPGINNLSNLGKVSQYGRKFMQHTGPMSLSAFLMIDKNVNIVKSLQWASLEYTQFKKDVIFRMSTKGFDGTPRDIADQVLLSYTTSKNIGKSAFYYSDMVPFGAASVREYIVEDPRFLVYVIDSIFDPKSQTKRSILVYVNENQLLYGKDYVFETTDAFIKILANLTVGDKIVIKDYSNTDGCYVPLTPSKLGLYPLYEPMIYVDDTHRSIVENADGTTSTVSSSIKIIQGHDGSRFTAYNDYRDDVILEIEKRIYNSVRVDYDPTIFDIYDVLSGYYRRTEFTKAEVNNVLITEFLKWNSIPSLDFNSPSITIGGEKTPRFQWVDGDTFTYNYNRSMAPNGQETLYGYWRGIYKYFYDTDRPHTHPWEMQGFTIKPTWWEEVYGLPPYTSENKIMWDAIEAGLINDPKNRRTNFKFARPGLGNYLPVDDEGNLLSPSLSGLAQNFSKASSQGRYTFGDQAPVETAWRQSSEYPFAIMIAMCVLRSSEFIGKMWDRFTIKRNIAGQIYSTVTNKKISPTNLPFSNELKEDGTRTITNGLANFIDEYVLINQNINYDYYKSLIRGLNVKLSYRIGGFTSKEKIKVLLDSRTPNSSGTVFLPTENYKIFYNRSAPVETVDYSGVIIEKRTGGYSVKGYDRDKNVFEIFPPRISSKDPIINVGGISEAYVEWATNQYYIKGQIVRINSNYYRALLNHTSSPNVTTDLTANKWQRLPFLPITGGRDAYLRSRFMDVPIRIPYGTIFEDIQSVVDFLLGYQQRLKDWGFQFDEFSTDLNVPLNWVTSAKEFMFWTLQSWPVGSVITLSPAANLLRFKPNITASVDNLDSKFYEYSIFKSDGTPLKADLTDIYREDNGFTIQPTINTVDGIYHIRSNLIYQEHVMLFDNTSIFNDVIYDVVPGYRQGRLKLLGFKTNNWDGSYYSPGFIFDNAQIVDWNPNTDYNIGDVVQYKNFYYTALNKIYGTTSFDKNSGWSQLSSKPVPKLEPNLDYRIEQFRDFYSLESSNFDESQVNLARHLTGYQPRQYLEDIVNDDVSQYKFYEGFIKEKGTENSITKLFDALRASGQSSIDIKEEWAFKVGDFGASDAYQELEFILDETKFRHNPQDILLSLGPKDVTDQSIYNITIQDTVKKSISYDAKPFVKKDLDFTANNYGVFKYAVAGYVNPLDTDHIVYDENTLLNYDITKLKHGDKIWIGNTPNGQWNILGYYNTRSLITDWERIDNYFNLYLSKVPELRIGDLIVITNIALIDGIYKVAGIYNNFIQVFTNNQTVGKISFDSTHGVLFKFEQVRYASPTNVSLSRYTDLKISGEKIWIDKDSNNEWKVLENVDAFTESNLIPPLFSQTDGALNGSEIKISGNKKFLFVSAIGSSGGKVIVYKRPNNTAKWTFLQSISLPQDFNFNSGIEKFGYSIDVSYDGLILAISAPDISGIKSYYKGDFDPNLDYIPGDVVRYNNQLWQNLHAVHGDGSSINVTTQDWTLLQNVYELIESGYSSGLTKQGAVFVYKLDTTNRNIYLRDTHVFTNSYGFEIEREQVICSYSPLSNERFGTKVKISQEGSQYWLYVSSEYYQKQGAIQVFKRNADGVWQYNLSQQYINFDNVLVTYINPFTPQVGSLYGYDIAVYLDRIAISAPMLGGGTVYIFKRISTIFFLVETINSYTIANKIVTGSITSGATINDSDGFGYALSMKGNNLFVSSPNNDTGNSNVGIVYKFTWVGTDSSTNPIELTQIILPPSQIQNERFGLKIDTNSDQSILTISSSGGNAVFDTTFDVYTERLVYTNDSTRNYELDANSIQSLVATSFDKNATKFYDRTPYTGAVYVYNAFDDHLIYADKLAPLDTLVSYDNFGCSLAISDDTIVVGASNRLVNNAMSGSSYVFDYNFPTWKVISFSNSVVDINKFKKSFIYNTVTNSLITNLEFIDPAKGLIPGPAEQEIKYQTMRDPANYDYINASTVKLDQSNPWREEHVGEVWWDLSTAKWIWYEQGDSAFRSTYWGVLFPGSSIDVYEWVETTVLPSEWLRQATSVSGQLAGYTGTPIYTNDLTYSTKQKYDSVSGTLSTFYYYWVKNKVTIPNKSFRKISVYDVAQLILDPAAVGYQYIAVTDVDSLSLVNVKPNIYHRDINLNVQFYAVDNTDLLVHREYALIAEGDKNSLIPDVVETKWIDSLCGTNVKGQPVPDPRLSIQQRYGASNAPRQTWFVNRFEALKQYIEYVNSILIKNQIVDNINFVNLLRADPQPTLNSGLIDQIVDIYDDLRFIGTAKIRSASLTPIVKNGQIVNVIINDKGYGYKISPIIKVLGTGTGGVLKATLDSNGSISSVEVIKPGKEYDTYSTRISIRNYTVLVLSDSEALGGWSLYELSNNHWYRIKTQGWNVTRYWYYADWYAQGFNSNVNAKFQVDRTVNLEGLPAQIGDIVKVNNVGGNWLLLRRKSVAEDPNYTVVYDVVGKQNATIQFSDKLYNLNKDLGYDTIYSFDDNLYDQGPDTELRIILYAIRDNILIDDLRIEYINLFFNSVNYALHEQIYVDWVFKTSFLKVNHTAGELKQRITFQSDMLPSYQQYIEEVKPYKTKIREFLDSYTSLDVASQQNTDFDLFSYYNPASGKIERGSLQSPYINTYPWKDWYDNHTFEVTEIIVYNQGNGYTSIPQVIITGDGRDASATAYLAAGKISKIVVDNPGYGYTRAPSVTISGGNSKTDIKATAVAKIGNNKVRTNTIGIRYDRISPSYTTSSFAYTDTFSGDGTTKKFKLTFAPDIKKVNFNILVNHVEIYGSLYDVSIVQVVHDTYTALEGYVIFATAPSLGVKNVTIQYLKNIEILDAADRIHYGYNPTTGQYGKDLGQLMLGVDYGGVQLQSIDFDIGGGWDVLPWDVSSWDNVLTTNDDYVVLSDGTTRSFTLPYIPAVGEIINIYVNGIRIDDINWDGSTTNPSGLLQESVYVVMESFIGDGINNIITIPNTYNLHSEDLITFRKSTSDGTILPTDRSLIDSFVDGGNLSYSTAKGIAAEEIIVDGDAFVTPDTSHGPEELVQGQVVDTLDINVLHAPSFGGPNVHIRNYTGDGQTSTFSVGKTIDTLHGMVVISGGIVLNNVEDSTLPQNDPRTYQVDFKNDTIIMNTAPALGEKISITMMDTAGYDILEKISFVGDGSSTDFLTGARFNNGNISGFVTINGISSKFDLVENVSEILVPSNGILVGGRYRIISAGSTDFTLIGSTDNNPGTIFVATGNKITGTGQLAYNVTGNAVVRFAKAPKDGDYIQIMLFKDIADEQHLHKWSEIRTEYITVVPGQYNYVLHPSPAKVGPLSEMAFVIVDNEFLQAPAYEFFTYDGSKLVIADLRFGPNVLSPPDINVYKNGIKLTPVQDYLFDSVESSVTLQNNVGVNGDFITIEILKLSDYRIDTVGWDGSTIQNVTLEIHAKNYTILNQKMIRVMTFTNHDIIKIKTSDFGFQFDTGYDMLRYDITQYDILSAAINTSGILNLPRSVGYNSGVFVALSRKLLTPNVDYVVLDNRNQIKVLLPDILTGSDYIQIITFDDKTVQPSYGFKIFKDMMNRFIYKRLDTSTTTKLKQDLLVTDTTITVFDGSILPIPSKQNNLPGVIEIDGERIEYFVKEHDQSTNTWKLSQLRRGTFGTGIKEVHSAGTEVVDFGAEQTVPYADQEVKKTIYADGSSHVYSLDFVPKARTGTIEDGSTIVSSWYRKTIPWNYGQCDEIEVFVAGTRLNKTPYKLYNHELGQDSYKGLADQIIEADFSVDGINPTIRFTMPPPAGSLIVIVHKQGRLWQKTTETSSLVFSETDIARFLRAKQVILPK